MVALIGTIFCCLPRGAEAATPLLVMKCSEPKGTTISLEPVMDQGQVSGTPEHEVGEGDEVEAGQRLGQALVVAGEPATTGHPGEGTLDDPPAGQQDEPPLRRGRRDHLQDDAVRLGG